MRRQFIKGLTILGALTFLWLVVVVGALIYVAASKRSVPRHTIVELDLQKNLLEEMPDGPLARLNSRGSLRVRDVVFALEKAATDSHVLAVFARVGPNTWGIAQTQEIRDAVLAFRKSGKPAIAFAETLGEGESSDRQYYLATGFDEIWMQPSGEVDLLGLGVTTPFIRGTLDKLGIVPRFDGRKEYKNAINELTEKAYTPAHREATLKLINSIADQLVQGIAAAQKRPEKQVRQLIENGPYLAQAAQKAGLVTGLAYRDDVVAKLKEKVGHDPKMVFVEHYFESTGSPYTHGPTIALIYGVGGVTRGPSDPNLFASEPSMGSDTVAGALRAASEDKDVKAIVFRIDSPGGSPVAPTRSGRPRWPPRGTANRSSLRWATSPPRGAIGRP